MKELYYPRSLVVIGTSQKKGNLGLGVHDNLKIFNFQGKAYYVGRSGGSIGDDPIYTSLSDVPRPIDQAVILVPAAGVLGVLEECAEAGVKWAVIMTGGFSEFSESKVDVEAQMLDICRRSGMRIIGPNCIGMANTDNGMVTVFQPLPNPVVQAGDVGIISQSGGLLGHFLCWFSSHRVGVSKGVSVGNKLNTNEVDCLKYLLDDPLTKVVTMYLESISNGRTFFEETRKSKKPIVVYKSNIVPGGSAMAKSHTASLASDEKIVDAACKQANVIRARSLRETLALSKALSLPPMRGNRLGIVARGGGAAVIMSDYCYMNGFNLPPLPDSVRDVITPLTPAGIITRDNPLDLGDTPATSVAHAATEAFLKAPEVDGVILCWPLLTAPPNDDPALPGLMSRLGELSRELDKPLAISFSPRFGSMEDLRRQVSFPVFDNPEETVEAMAVSRDYWRRQEELTDPLPSVKVDKSRAQRIIDSVRASGSLDFGDSAADLLGFYGINIEPLRPARTAEAAVAVARNIGYPVVMKVHSPQISHKTDVGGVAVNIADDNAVIEAFNRITSSAKSFRPDAEILGVTVQKMVAGGVEVIVGAKWDEQFGPVVMYGMGGVMVELLNDVSFRLAPITEREAREMIDEVKTSKLLRGFRGQEPGDIDALVDTLVRLARLVADFPEIGEVDINPLKVFAQGKGCKAVDARVFLRKS